MFSRSSESELALFAPAEGRLSLRKGGLLDTRPAGEFFWKGERFHLPRFHLRGPEAEHDTLRLGLFAGIHGDEPAGTDALLHFVSALTEDPSPAKGYELFVYPAVNPVGLARGTRENGNGRDLNREFWKDSDQEEVRIVERELRLHQLDGLVTLHADDTCEGMYGYAHGRTLDEALLKPALAAAERFLPRDRRKIIDGFPAQESLLCDCYKGVLSAPPELRPQPFNLIIETPARANHALQVAAGAATVASVLNSYRSFIAYAANL